jgi:hypothetical protein
MANRWAVSVPDGYLDVPYPHERRRILRFEAGLALDAPLRRLSRLSGAVDRALALRLARLQAARSYIRLGYARLGDYSRERLGLAERTTFDLARLGRALERLPLVDHELAAGRLTWTAAFQVARVAGVDDETTWVERAGSLPVRELKQRVRQELSARKAGSRTSERSATGTEHDPDGSTDDDAKRDRFGRMLIHANARTASYWYAALDLCRQVAGADLPETEAAEYVLADFVSGGSALPDDMPRLYPRAPVHYPAGSRRGLYLVGRGRRELPPVAKELGSHVLDAKSTRDLDDLLRLVDSGEVSNDPFELDASMRRLVAARCGVDLDLARLLRNFESLDLAPHLGFERFGDYAEARLGISARRARFLVQLDRKLYGYPAIQRAVRDGRVGTVAAMLLTRVVLSRVTEDVWIGRAERITVARLRREVEWAERGVALRRFRTPLPPPDGRIKTALDELTDELSRQRQTFAIEGEGECGGKDGAGQTFAVAEGISTAPGADGRMRPLAPDDAEWVRRVFKSQSPQVDVVFWIAESAVPLWDEARRQIAFHTGEQFVPDQVVLLWLALDFLATHLPSWLEALDTEDRIAVRERFRCAIPGCTVHGGAGHHLEFRSQGGSDEDENLLFTCYIHHIPGVHAGCLRVTGEAPDRLKIDLGIRPDGTALDSFVNGRRVLSSDNVLRVATEDAA